MQTFEIASHIWNRWAEIHGDQKLWDRFNRQKPEDWTELQVKGAKRAMAISHAGVGSHVTSTILMDPDHLLKKDA
jgi:acetyl-CoA C-acetyltransferase